MTKQIETETYGIISNVDYTITKLNPLIKNDGYEFVSVTLQDLELKYSEIFYISRDFNPKQSIVKSITSNGFNMISDQFEQALKYYFAGNEYEFGEIYLLKRIQNTFTEQGETYIQIGNSASAEIELANYTRMLIRRLRLYKQGQIDFQGYFSILKENRRVIQTHKTPNKPIYSPMNYTIIDEDINDLSKLLKKDINIPELLNLAIESFELAYEASDRKIRFVLLMISIESIFNRSSKDPIMHIISRHSALLLSKDKIEFDAIFKQVKRLYDTRCDIVHGTTDKKRLKKLESNLDGYLAELEQLTRQVILKCLWLNEINDKEKLFDYLNKRGFEG